MSIEGRFGIHVEESVRGEFPEFLARTQGKRILVMTDETTRPLAEGVLGMLEGHRRPFGVFTFPSQEPVADEATVQAAVEAGGEYDYLLAVGAGTLNDLAKRSAFLLGKESGVFATAPSMDGYTSGVTPLIEKGFKITRNAQTASDILLDYEVLKRAPKIMIGAGVGDILAKYCCLADWRISSFLTGEEYGREAAELMYEAVRACDESIPLLLDGDASATEKLMNALIVSGYAMVLAGSSRPASGAEHHMSHYLEMDFLKRGRRIPLHGVKVGLGTAVSLYLYHTLKDREPFEGSGRVCEEAEGLPSSEYVLGILGALGCPVRFSELGVSRETVRNMLFDAYKIRDRYTILTLYCTKGLMRSAADEIVERFY